MVIVYYEGSLSVIEAYFFSGRVSTVSELNPYVSCYIDTVLKQEFTTITIQVSFDVKNLELY
jgi:hypothetical protein